MIEYFVSNNEPNITNILILALAVWIPMFSYQIFRERQRNKKFLPNGD